jgi:predicted nicotinamide N-methyase
MEPERSRRQPRTESETARTNYRGPVVVTRAEVGGRTIHIVRPAEPDRLLDDPAVVEWNRRDNYMSYWAYLWPAASMLAEAVTRAPWLDPPAGGPPLEVLEIGCGLGLAGLAALARGARVIFTDIDQAALEFVARSAAENGFARARFELRLLDWRDPPEERFPVILGADVIYEAPLVPVVANLLGALLAPGGVSLIASPYRASADLFPAALRSCGLLCRTEPARARAEDGRFVDGTIYHVMRRAL